MERLCKGEAHEMQIDNLFLNKISIRYNNIIVLYTFFFQQATKKEENIIQLYLSKPLTKITLIENLSND